MISCIVIDDTRLKIFSLKKVNMCTFLYTAYVHRPSSVFHEDPKRDLEDPKYVRFYTESYVNIYRPFGIFLGGWEWESWIDKNLYDRKIACVSNVSQSRNM